MSRYNKDIYENRLHSSLAPFITTSKGLSVATTPSIDDFENSAGAGVILKYGGIGWHSTPSALIPGQCYWLYHGSNSQSGLNLYPGPPTWWKVDNDAPRYGGSTLIGMALGTVPTVDGILLKGFVRIPDANITGTPVMGQQCFISANGVIAFDTVDTTTNPTAGTVGDFSKVVGYCIEKNDDGDALIYFNPEKSFTRFTLRGELFREVDIRYAHDQDNSVITQVSDTFVPAKSIITRVSAGVQTLSNLGTHEINIQLSTTNGTAADSLISSGTEILGAGAAGTISTDSDSVSDISLGTGASDLKDIWYNNTLVRVTTSDMYVHVCNAGTGNGTTNSTAGTIFLQIEYYGMD